MATKAAPQTSSLERLVEQFEEQNKYWEVSLYDISQDTDYLTWLQDKFEDSSPKNINGKLHSEGYYMMEYPLPPNDILFDILYKFGLNVDEDIDQQENIHKTFAGFKVYGKRWVGVQRTDQDWKDFCKKYGV